MIIIALLVAISLSIALAFLLLFLWNLKSGQYEDTHTPSVRMLFDNPGEKKGDSLPSDRKVSRSLSAHRPADHPN